MWRRAYLLLALVRLYFALSPSYLHPDENFQGPEVIAGTSSIFAVQVRGHPDIPERKRPLFPSVIVGVPPFYPLTHPVSQARYSATPSN